MTSECAGKAQEQERQRVGGQRYGVRVEAVVEEQRHALSAQDDADRRDEQHDPEHQSDRPHDQRAELAHRARGDRSAKATGGGRRRAGSR